MIYVQLKARFFIDGLTPSVWEVATHCRAWKHRRTDLDLGFERNTLAQAATLQEAFEAALKSGLAEPGQPLDLSGFNSLIRDSARRFEVGEIGAPPAGTIRMSDGYKAERLGIDGPGAWHLVRDCGRGGKHAVQIGDAPDVAQILAAAVWHAVFRESRMTATEVGPLLCGIAHKLLYGATADVAETESAKL